MNVMDLQLHNVRNNYIKNKKISREEKITQYMHAGARARAHPHTQ